MINYFAYTDKTQLKKFQIYVFYGLWWNEDHDIFGIIYQLIYLNNSNIHSMSTEYNEHERYVYYSENHFNIIVIFYYNI